MAANSVGFRIQAVDSEGRALSVTGTVLPALGPAQPWLSEVPLQLPPGPTTVTCDYPPGCWDLELSVGAGPELPSLQLKLCQFEVLLADPGGRELGGLPIRLSGAGAQITARVGMPVLAWAGHYTLEVGDPTAGVALNSMPVILRPGRSSLELGRLAALVTHWGEGTGWPVRALLLAGPSEDRSDAALAPRSLEQLGRTGEPLTLWPGRYRINVDGGPQAVQDLPGGHLTELELGSPTRGATLRAQRDLVGAIERLATDMPSFPLAGPLLSSGLAGLARRLRPLPRNGEERSAVEALGPSVRVEVADARNYSLTGWPLCLLPLEPHLSLVEGRVGIEFPARPGRYALHLEGLPGPATGVTVPDGPVRVALGPLGALEVILRDGQGRSLRGMRYDILSGDKVWPGVLGRAAPLPPGRYQINVPVFPPLARVLHVLAGRTNVVDLGALARVELGTGPELAMGSPHTLVLEALFDRTGSPEGSDEAQTPDTTRTIRVGESLDVQPGTYRLIRAGDEGHPERLELRPGRVRRPSVLGRSVDALAHEDANRER